MTPKNPKKKVRLQKMTLFLRGHNTETFKKKKTEGKSKHIKDVNF